MDLQVLEQLGITKDDVINRMADKLIDDRGMSYFLDAAKKCIETEALKRVQPTIDQFLTEVIGNIADLPYIPVNNWGEPLSKESTTLRRMVQDRSLVFLTEQVDRDGKPHSFRDGIPRAEWMAQEAAKKAMTHETKAAIKDAVEKSKAELQRQVAEYVASTIMPKR